MMQIRRWITSRYSALLRADEDLSFKTQFVNKKGLASVCDAGPSNGPSINEQIDVNDYAAIKNGDLVYVITAAVPSWFEKIYPRLCREGIKIILVTGDTTYSAPLGILKRTDAYDFETVMSDGVITHWFAQNCDLSSDPRVTPIPLGIDYHSLHFSAKRLNRKKSYQVQDALLEKMSQGVHNTAAWTAKAPSMLIDFHFSLHTNPQDRQAALDAAEQVQASAYLPSRVGREKYWQTILQTRFVLSPLGRGLDCHRTWEALVLGAVPIIRKSTISPLFKELPVIEVESYTEVTDALLAAYQYPTQLAVQKLKLNFWTETMLAAQKRILTK